MKILSVVGARPQFIKAFAVSKELRTKHEEVLVHTGQHYDEELSDVFFEKLNIPQPDYNLGVGSGSHGEQTAEMLVRLEELIEDEQPDFVLLYGDTNSTLAGVIAGTKLDTKVAHVEAGLRSHNREMPEEINRVLTDHGADLLLAPSPTAVDQLSTEGRDGVTVETGDVMYDALLEVRDRVAEESNVLEQYSLSEGEFILSTVHRAVNTDSRDRLEAIFEALSDAPLPVILPLHPRTESYLKEYGLWEFANEYIQIVDPLDYLDFVCLMDAAERIVTDSGGIQKEAFFLDTFCVTMRDETEWTETVDAGWNTLVGADLDMISAALNRDWERPVEKPEPYGDGNASREVRLAIEEYARK
ncbi:non-hydrolyzing UDP-N-acetylglucosamine 2-epimerase [Halohasta litorea]|uniref:Non-hydrolyzing UDP-N-acetylglucosamine 2-epimerase n=1 Tax=Halohasta litorea TaxID=869891 RepID=A0ABD6D743_9EURY|nr:UDP-N-acetylglucosamine 2-epimerase (non-hydrolyzing) [Halohasta litorea]